jgi:Na+/H+ antiporter NhaC
MASAVVIGFVHIGLIVEITSICYKYLSNIIQTKITVMKNLIKKISAKFYLTVLVFLSTIIFAFSQDSGSSSSSSTTTQTATTTTHIQPWMWIVGAAILLIILIALLRGGRRDSVTVTKTTTTDTDV